ncbi:MAG TPA: MerR family transcriptional regulator [Caulobacteraceae bacterium]|jgi:DNA-binding transcriptional MerR regulator|nr:MerR family transcriptional regulator [Caulobacteraceae bacterium]
MKMRELEQRSGVGRETIRYYIGLGLLPEPARPKPNVADYGEEHVRRLGVIKRLQAERYLPLGFIKQVLDRPTSGEIAALPGLEGRLAASLGVAAANGGTSLADAAAESGLTPAELEVLVRDRVVEAPGGALSPIDLAIAKAWGRVRASGYSPDAGFFAEDAAIYVEALEPLTRREIERFYGRLAGSGTIDDAARLGQAGIELINDLIALLRTRLLLGLVAEMNARAASGAAPPPGS